MELQHVNIKIFAEHPGSVDPAKFTPLFQRWIQDQVCEGELLIDVADYLHVPNGPGIVLVGHEADYSMDSESERRLGLRYNRKTSVDGDNAARFRQALRATLQAAQRLEQDPRLEGKLKFSRGELDFYINDRALAPNSESTLRAVRPELERFLDGCFGAGAYRLTHDPDPRVRFGLKAKFSQDFALEKILEKLS